MQNIKLLNFIDLKLEEKEMILKWRNHPEIRKWMYNQDEIKLEEHLSFIESLNTKEDKFYFGNLKISEQQSPKPLEENSSDIPESDDLPF